MCGCEGCDGFVIYSVSREVTTIYHFIFSISFIWIALDSQTIFKFQLKIPLNCKKKIKNFSSLTTTLCTSKSYSSACMVIGHVYPHKFATKMLRKLQQIILEHVDPMTNLNILPNTWNAKINYLLKIWKPMFKE